MAQIAAAKQRKAKQANKRAIIEKPVQAVSQSPDSHILELLQKESDSARRVILLIPCFQEETQEQFRQYMRLRSIESFFMECHSWAVTKRKQQMKAKLEATEEMKRALAYRMAQVWEILHPGWEAWHDQISDYGLSDKQLMELLENAPFRLAYERYPLLTQTHFLDAVAHAPAQQVQMQLDIAADQHLNSHDFRNHLKEAYGQKLNGAQNHDDKATSKQLELLKEELRIAREEKQVLEAQNDQLIIKLHEIENPKPLFAVDFPCSKQIARLHEAYLAWEQRVVVLASDGGAEAVLEAQDGISDILCEFFESVKQRMEG